MFDVLVHGRFNLTANFTTLTKMQQKYNKAINPKFSFMAIKQTEKNE